ncbi:MAG: tRNA (uridine(34)/cytosine(34)/5-carboxymethylaminomethyluridine(34)-2'-O)-methyltransferase TrmL [Lachnospiraceae bacterium]|nr:tRNA (uridine(34)/cytosine(34)/5-carboxymethylaminomethyluridine(34)-2'-O)-methyltransferase TrmL [Lachnospiraceae bacterium]
MFHIVLHEPEIPANTGNIGRTALASGSRLHLIEPLGFVLTGKMIKRAGMDYWDQVDVARWRDYEHFLKETGAAERIWYVTTKAQQSYTDVDYKPGDYLMFGKESAGIPEEILAGAKDRCVRIPMAPGIRSLNLSNSVAIVLYEALRQQGFEGLEEKGQLHRLTWQE